MGSTPKNISVDELQDHGAGLHRCECVLATKDGNLYTSDKDGGISVVSTVTGETKKILATNKPEGFMPNGFAILDKNNFLVANLGPTGGVYKLNTSGVLTSWLLEVEGKALEPTNFVGIDRFNRTWVTVSTRHVPREQSLRAGVNDGYMILIDEKGARIVADDFGFTNEAIVDQSGQYIYVNETMNRRTRKFRITERGELADQEIFAEYGPGTWPDGMALDEEGAVWIVSVVSNRVIRTTVDGKQQILLEDTDSDRLDRCETAYQANQFTRNHLDSGRDGVLGNLSGLCFGGSDLKTIYLGSLFGTTIRSFRTSVAGQKPVHWDL